MSFESPDARTAMRVTERLASLFVQENLEDRELLADQTNQFLQAQLEEARRRLVEHEKKLEEFRQRNNGQLPEQVQSNLQMMQSAQMQLQSARRRRPNRDRDRLLMLRAQRWRTRCRPRPPSSSPAPRRAPTSRVAGTAAQQLEAARASFARCELRLKPEHPDIGRAKRVIAELEGKAEAEALQQPLSRSTPAPTVEHRPRRAGSASSRCGPRCQEIRPRLESGKREAARLQDAGAGSRRAGRRPRPALESELTELMRDYATLQEGYTSLLQEERGVEDRREPRAPADRRAVPDHRRRAAAGEAGQPRSRAAST